MTRIEILNPWNSKIGKLQFFTVNEPVYQNGDYRIFHQFANCYLYTYKNIAINQLAGLNKDHLNSLATKQRPENDFLYNRALENKRKALQLL